MSIVYGIVIVLFCAIFIAFFVLRDKKQKRRRDELISKMEDSQPQPTPPVEQKEEVVEPQPKIDVFLEDFKIDDASKPKDKVSLNPFEGLEDDDEDEFAEYERFLKRNMQLEEEKRRNQNNSGREKLEEDLFPKRSDIFTPPEFEDDTPQEKTKEEEENEILDAIAEFDVDSVIGKSEEEINEVLEKLPPKAREIIVQTILSRNDFDED